MYVPLLIRKSEGESTRSNALMYIHKASSCQRCMLQLSAQPAAAKDALEKVESGDWVLVDVRPNNRYEESHPEGAVNVPLYQKVRPSCCS